jgi:Skp family chaperone for outer membrane proteins
MKKTFAALFTASVLALTAITASAAPGKIVVVDLDQVFDAHPKTVASSADLKKREADALAEMEKLAERQKTLQADIEAAREAAKSSLLSEEAKKEKRQQLEQKETEYQAFIVSARRQQELKLQSLREEVLEMRKQIVEEMRTELVAFAKAEGYALIFDKSGLTMNGVPVIAYSHPALDVTQAFIDYIHSDKATAADAAK